MIALLDKDILYKHYMLMIESIQKEFGLTTEEATKYFEMNRDYGIQVRQNAQLEVAKKHKDEKMNVRKNIGTLKHGVSMTPKEIEVYRQCYRETVEFIMNEFKLTTKEACQYINVNPLYSLGIRIKASKLLIETNLNRNG